MVQDILTAGGSEPPTSMPGEVPSVPVAWKPTLQEQLHPSGLWDFLRGFYFASFPNSQDEDADAGHAPQCCFSAGHCLSLLQGGG